MIDCTWADVDPVRRWESGDVDPLLARLYRDMEDLEETIRKCERGIKSIDRLIEKRLKELEEDDE